MSLVLSPGTSNARVISYIDSIDNSTYASKLSPVREHKFFSPKATMDYTKSPEVKKFF